MTKLAGAIAGASMALPLLFTCHTESVAEEPRPFLFRDRFVSVAELDKAAQGGDVDAMLAMGSALLNGDHVTHRPADGLDWFRRAAREKHSPKAAIALGVRYAHGLDVPADGGQAKTWLEQADAWGDPQGATELGKLYQTGAGVAQSYAEAARWYRRAAELGVPEAEWLLGKLTEDGTGVPRDLPAAKRWYAAAAAQGNSGAQEDFDRLASRGVSWK